MAAEKRSVTYLSDGFPMHAYFCVPAGEGPFPGVIVLHELSGLDDHIKSVSERLAENGFAALAVDLYSRRGGIPQISSADELMRLWMDMDDMLMVKDISHGVLFLRGESAVRGDRIGVLGFCLGGTMALLMGAYNVFLKASISFYGTLKYAGRTPQKPAPPLDVLSYLNCPLLYVYGERDTVVRKNDVETLQSCAREKNKSLEVLAYADCGHGFFNEKGADYHKEPAEDAWVKTLLFLKRHLCG